MRKVLILKSENDTSDNYSKLLSENNINPIFIPSLDFQFKNQNGLREKLNSASDNYSGIIFTSSRSVTAVSGALGGAELSTEWFKLHNYCVGQASEKEIFTQLKLSTKGSETGNASNLAEFIASDLKEKDINKPFLFPCGNLKQDILENKLQAYGYNLDSIEVYETIPHPNLAQSLQEHIMSSPDRTEYIVFFSPSGVDYCSKVFAENNFHLTTQHLIAIGPSTQKAIERNGWTVYGTCDKPSPESLLKIFS